jgi:predicted Zn-dependent protease
MRSVMRCCHTPPRRCRARWRCRPASAWSRQRSRAASTASSRCRAQRSQPRWRSEADRIGIELAAKAGYNPNAAVSLWEKMGKVGGGDGKSSFDFLSTHPAPVKRMQALSELVPKMMPYYRDQSPRPVFPLGGSGLAAGPKTK